MSAAGRALRGQVFGDGQAAPLAPSTGSAVPFRNEHCEGAVYLAHRPLGGTLPADEARLRLHDISFELQIQVRLRAPPRGTVFISGELRDGPMKLNLVTRSLCRVLLGFISKQAARRGVEIRYSFGDSKAHPHMAGPALAADRVVVSEEALPLPVDTSNEPGTWRAEGGRLRAVDRSAVRYGEGQWVTMIVGAAVVSLDDWRLTNVPGVGGLELAQFWGSQGLHLVLFDGDAGDRRELCHVEFLSTAGPAREPPGAALPAAAPAAPVAEEVEETVVDWADAAVEGAEAPASPGPAAPAEDEGVGSGGDDSDGSPRLEGVDDDIDVQLQSRILEASDAFVTSLDLGATTQETAMLASLGTWEDGGDGGDGAWEEGGGTAAVPWYFQNWAGHVWWCVAYRGRLTWRHDTQVRALGAALGLPQLPERAAGSVRALEAERRAIASLLARAAEASGLLEEFTLMEVGLGSLLSGESPSCGSTGAMLVGVVECEGRVVERGMRVRGGRLEWGAPSAGLRRGPRPWVELAGAVASSTRIAGAEAISVYTPRKTFLCVARDRRHRRLIEEGIEAASIAHRLRRGSTGSLLGQALALVGQALRLEGSAAAASERTGPRPRRKPHWKDPLLRWPAGRVVVNDNRPCLEVHADPLALSADLLRRAVAAQAGPEPAVEELTARSGALKCAALGGLGPQDLWCFWVNVFHALLVHARLVVGRPRGVQQMVDFFNHCSYLVAGHAFSLVEIEHCILRRNMSKPRLAFAWAVLKTWPRSDADLEERPCLHAPPCPAGAFACRPDWRLNLVLSAGNGGSSDALPVFEATDEASFDAAVQRAVDRTLLCCGSVGRDVVELPYNLSRYRGDLPGGCDREGSERRWAELLAPGNKAAAAVYRKEYSWSMRERLELLLAG